MIALNPIKRLFFLVGFLFIILGHQEAYSQTTKKTISPKVDFVEEGDSGKEELERYVGYENYLLLRYLTLPYDLSINVNERGNFVNMGFLHLMFIPLLFLALVWNHKIIRFFCLFMMFFMVLVSTSNSFIIQKSKKNIEVVRNIDGKFTKDLNASFIEDPITSFCEVVYDFNNVLYAPVRKLISLISLDLDHSTYPILVTIFCLFGFILFKLIKGREPGVLSILGILFFGYLYFWLILSSGILWYGYLMILLGLIIMFVITKRIEKNASLGHRWIGNTVMFFSIFWIGMNVFARMSNIMPGMHESRYGKEMYNFVTYEYGTGNSTEGEIVDKIFPGFDQAIKKVNKDKDALVYRIGTSLSYFVENNHNRVYADNQLAFFNEISAIYPDKNTLTRALKATGFKYFFLDLGTPTLDKTDEKTLVKKYTNFLKYVYENDGVELMATNGVIKVKDPNTGEYRNFYGIFGERVSVGSFAIFEIL